MTSVGHLSPMGINLHAVLIPCTQLPHTPNHSSSEPLTPPLTPLTDSAISLLGFHRACCEEPPSLSAATQHGGTGRGAVDSQYQVVQYAARSQPSASRQRCVLLHLRQARLHTSDRRLQTIQYRQVLPIRATSCTGCHCCPHGDLCVCNAVSKTSACSIR